MSQPRREDLADKFHTSGSYQALDLRPLAELPPETWSAELYFADALVDAVVTDQCRRVLNDLGLATGDPDEVAARAGVVTDRRYAFDWCLLKLASSGQLAISQAGEIGEMGPPKWSHRALADAIEERRPRLGATFDLIIDTAGRHYPAFLRGEIDGNAAVLNRESLKLWERYFHNDNLPYAAINTIAASTAEVAVGQRQLRVLEVGGGLASAAEALLERVSDKVREYWFTELVPGFLIKGKALIAQRFPGVELVSRRIDLNRPLAEQGVPDENFDLVYAVNVLHAVRDLSFSLSELHTSLCRGGVLVLGEAIRPKLGALVPIEFVFQLMREFREIVTDPVFRPVGGFLFHEHWDAALRSAGFSAPRVVPDMKSVLSVFPTYAMAAIVAERE